MADDRLLHHRTRPRRAAVLLEVVLALALFLAGAAIILEGLSACLGAARDLRLKAQAQDLLVTVGSQIQMGLIAPSDAGPNPFDDPALEGWTWQVAVTSAETTIQNAGLKRAEISIVNATERMTVRQMVMLSPEISASSTAGSNNAGVVTPGAPPPVSVPVGGAR
ncbi:MAG: hypothetical protein NTW19_19990 [Planctomycetota bacterium]|nr:hypothetical protein [Planctomycetota bacterium]